MLPTATASATATPLSSNSDQSDNKNTQQPPISFLPSSLIDLPPFIINPSAPVPPNWEDRFREAIAINPSRCTTFIRVPLDEGTREYRILAELFHSNSPMSRSGQRIVLQKIELNINMILWRKFLVHHTQNMGRKSSDLEILKGLEFNAGNSSTVHKAFDFIGKDDFLTPLPDYSDNICLLFHGTRASVDKILEEGLDERMANGGLLGHGIYFSDDPYKSCGYDVSKNTLLVCAVFLGDCLKVDRGQLDRSKTKIQMRHPSDTHFDSIMGRPFNANEFMIFSRFQCYPLYVITYGREGYVRMGNPAKTIFNEVQNRIPEFCWKRGADPKCQLADSKRPQHYPFFAQTIFKLMDSGDHAFIDPASMGSIFGTLPNIRFPRSIFPPNPYLKQLHELGVFNDKLNLKLLSRHKNDLTFVLDELYEIADNTVAEDEAEPKDCLICAERYPNSEKYWKKSRACCHEFCINCYQRLETTNTALSGISYEFFKCPFCQARSGVEIGKCPMGTMKCRVIERGDKWIKIDYTVSAYNLHRTAYLPDTPEGRRVKDLLEIAWDRRLVFTIGTSATTGVEDTLIWNIHHKTATSGGPPAYGYPDDTYLARVTEELKQFGIQWTENEPKIDNQNQSSAMELS